MKFSIIIPVYNAAKYLRPCLDSVLAQTEKDWECVCVDDGSTDGSAAILDEYVAGDSRFIVSHQENAGVSVARNKGLKIASGEYVCFVDADDFVDVDWLLAYADVIRENNVDIVRIKLDDRDEPCGVIQEGEALRDWLWNVVVKDGYPWSYAIRRELALHSSFPLGVAMCEDELFIARLIPYVHSAVQLETCGYRHIIRGDSAMLRPLSSRERYLYLEVLVAVVEANKCADAIRISRMCGDAILMWMGHPRDIEYRQDIRTIWLRLRKAGFARVDAVSTMFKFPYFIYAKVGWLWPMRTWSVFVHGLVVFRQKCKKH